VILCGFSGGNPLVPEVLSLAGQMKMGRGLLMCVALIKGDVVQVKISTNFSTELISSYNRQMYSHGINVTCTLKH
jgi:hypothetical protein